MCEDVQDVLVHHQRRLHPTHIVTVQVTVTHWALPVPSLTVHLKVRLRIKALQG